MKMNQPTDRVQYRTVAAAIRPPSIAWWLHVMLVLLCAGVAAAVAQFHVVNAPGLTWYSALIAGICVGELLMSTTSLVLAWRWSTGLRHWDYAWPGVAYQHYSAYLTEKKIALDKRSLREFSQELIDSVDLRCSRTYLFYALIGIVLTVPAFLAFIYAAKANGAQTGDFSVFWWPFAFTISSGSLAMAAGTFLLIRSNLGEWSHECCERRSTALADGIRQHDSNDRITPRKEPPSSDIQSGGTDGRSFGASTDSMADEDGDRDDGGRHPGIDEMDQGDGLGGSHRDTSPSENPWD
jgi:hypothetical protein